MKIHREKFETGEAGIANSIGFTVRQTHTIKKAAGCSLYYLS
jgi:hypothetical protein